MLLIVKNTKIKSTYLAEVSKTKRLMKLFRKFLKYWNINIYTTYSQNWKKSRKQKMANQLHALHISINQSIINLQ